MKSLWTYKLPQHEVFEMRYFNLNSIIMHTNVQ